MQLHLYRATEGRMLLPSMLSCRFFKEMFNIEVVAGYMAAKGTVLLWAICNIFRHKLNARYQDGHLFISIKVVNLALTLKRFCTSYIYTRVYQTPRPPPLATLLPLFEEFKYFGFLLRSEARMKIEALLLQMWRSHLRWLQYLYRMPPISLTQEIFHACPTWRKPQWRPGKWWLCSDYATQLTCECLGILPEVLEEVFGEIEVSAQTCCPYNLILDKRKWMDN